MYRRVLSSDVGGRNTVKPRSLTIFDARQICRASNAMTRAVNVGGVRGSKSPCGTQRHKSTNSSEPPSGSVSGGRASALSDCRQERRFVIPKRPSGIDRLNALDFTDLKYASVQIMFVR